MANSRIRRTVIVFVAILAAMVMMTAVSGYSSVDADTRSLVYKPMAKQGAVEPVPTLYVQEEYILIDVLAGDTAQANITIVETGGQVGAQGIKLSATDLSDGTGQVIAATNITFEPVLFDLPPGEEQEIALTVAVPAGLPESRYQGSVLVESLNAETVAAEFVVRTSSATIFINKQADDAGTQSFDFTGDLGKFSLAASESAKFEVPLGEYFIYEVQTMGWGLVDIECEIGGPDAPYVFTFQNGFYVYASGDGSVTCTFYNRKPRPSFWNTKFVGQVGGGPTAVAVQGRHAYLAEGLGLTVLDISNPARPTQLYRGDQITGVAYDVVMSGDFAYVSASDGLHIFDISDPSQPIEIGFLPTRAVDLALNGPYIYAAAGGGLRIIDVTNPASPTEIGFEQQEDPNPDCPFGLYDLNIVGDRLYAGWACRSITLLSIYDIGDPANPELLGSKYVSYQDYWDIYAAGNYVYVAESGVLQIYDVSNPSDVIEVADYWVDAEVVDVMVANEIAYVIIDGSTDTLAPELQILDVSDPTQPTLIGQTLIGPYEHRGDLTISGDIAYIPDAFGGLYLVDISNPAAPIGIGFHENALAPVTQIAVHGNYAMMLAHGVYSTLMQTADMTDPSAPAPTEFSEEVPRYADLAVAGDYAYVVRHGLQIFSLANPAFPTKVGLLEISGRDIAVQGDLAFLAQYSEGLAIGLAIIDVGNPTRPRVISHMEVEGTAVAVAADGDYAYVASEDSWDEHSGLRIIDVSDPASPAWIGSVDADYFGVKEVEVSGHRVYVLHQEGMHIFDVADPAAPVVVGYPQESESCYARHLAVDGSIAYIADLCGIHVIDASDPAAPVEVGYYYTPGTAYDVALMGRYMAVADQYGGLLILRYVEEAAQNSITIAKEAEPATSDSFAFAGDLGGFSLSAGEDTTYGDLTPGSYTISEVGLTGWELERIVCDGAKVTKLENGVAIDLVEGGSVICTFHNSAQSVTAAAGGSYVGKEGDTISLDAGETTHQEMVDTYNWDCTNDGTFEKISSSPDDRSCKYTDNDVYTLKLRTVDIFGQTSEDTAEVTVANVAPQVEAGAGVQAVVGQAVQFTGSFNDPGTADTHTITWDFGDGGTQGGTLTPQHTYSAQGQYTVTLSVTDDDGGSGSDTLEVEVTGSPAKMRDIRVTPPAIHEGERFYLAGALDDPQGNRALTLYVDWGDGKTLTREFAAGTRSFSISHACLDDPPGKEAGETVGIDLKLSDETGAYSTTTAEIIVDNVAPSIEVGADQTVQVGETAIFLATVSDPGMMDTWTITWDFGDGSPAADGSGVGHVFDEAGTYTVKATVEDDDGGVGVDRISVVVKEVAISYMPVIIR